VTVARASAGSGKTSLLRFWIAEARLAASGHCVLAAADVFDQREEDGTIVLLNPIPPAQLAEDVRRAAALCPARAITVDE
jgi:ferredoxin